MDKLDVRKLDMITGGGFGGGVFKSDVKNPVCGVSFEDAMKKAEELGPNREDMGGWTRMNNIDYLKWWSSCNPSEYEKHKDEVDSIIGLKK